MTWVYENWNWFCAILFAFFMGVVLSRDLWYWRGRWEVMTEWKEWMERHIP